MATGVTMNRAAHRRIRTLDTVRQELYRRAQLVVTAINHPGYVAAASTGRSRARAAVIAASPYARRSNAIHNTLLTHLGAARGQ